MGKNSAKSLIPVFTFLLGSLLGSGILWQAQQARMAKKSHELATITAISELRGQVSDLSFRILELSAEYSRIQDTYYKKPTPEGYAKGEELKYKLELLKDDYRVLEGNLASMEKRMPSELHLSFPSLPPPHMNPIRPLLPKQ